MDDDLYDIAFACFQTTLKQALSDFQGKIRSMAPEYAGHRLIPGWEHAGVTRTMAASGRCQLCNPDHRRIRRCAAHFLWARSLANINMVVGVPHITNVMAQLSSLSTTSRQGAT
jgi:hypothetical protein